MRRALITTAAALLATAAAVSATVHASRTGTVPRIASADTTEGTWTADARQRGPERLQLNLMTGTSTWGQSMDLAELRGLSAEALASGTSTPVAFRIEREPGVFDMEGAFREGRGAGHFRFRPNREFGPTLRSLGIRGAERVTDGELMRLALAGASAEGVRGLSGLGLGPMDVEDVVKLFIFGVTPEYVREMRSLGITGANTVDGVVEMRIHRLSASFVREMESLGFRGLDREQLLQLSIHGVTPEYVRALREAGFDGLSARDVTEMRIHQVTPERVREFAALGYRGLERRELMQMSIHGVTPDRIREYRALGFRELTPGQLTRMAIHGVTPRFIREVREAGFRGDLSPDALVRMRIHGIGPEYLRRDGRRQD